MAWGRLKLCRSGTRNLSVIGGLRSYCCFYALPLLGGRAAACDANVPPSRSMASTDKADAAARAWLPLAVAPRPTCRLSFRPRPSRTSGMPGRRRSKPSQKGHARGTTQVVPFALRADRGPEDQDGIPMAYITTAAAAGRSPACRAMAERSRGGRCPGGNSHFAFTTLTHEVMRSWMLDGGKPAAMAVEPIDRLPGRKQWHDRRPSVQHSTHGFARRRHECPFRCPNALYAAP